MVETDTLRLARNLVDSVAADPAKTASALVGLAAVGSLGPVGALAATACGAALLHRRFSWLRSDPFGRTRAEVKAMESGFNFRIGSETGTGRPVTISGDEAGQHMLVMGKAEADKTSFLLGLSEQAIAAGSGVLYVDGKGDLSLFAKMFRIARRHGRLDDLLVLNMMTGNHDAREGNGFLLSNTLNPFATGSSDNLTQLVVSLMDEVGGDGAMWKGRATAMFTGLMKALVWLRDNDELRLDVGSLRDHLGFGAIVGLASGASAPGLPEEIRSALRAYLSCLPGYNPERGARQAQTTLDQHGYLEMQFTKILGSLADVYGHVYRTRLSDLDMEDVVLNRRIVMVMLPALEMSGDELANLGKIVVATLKGMMGAALGRRIAGGWNDIAHSRRATPGSPFLCVLDEVGYYAVEGLALMAAQARSLGFAMVYGSQDLWALKRLNEKEAASILANTNVTVFMRWIREEDCTSGGFVGHLPGIASRSGRADLFSWDFHDLPSGEGIVCYKGAEIRTKLAYFDAFPDRASTAAATLRANYLISLPQAETKTGVAR
jgi:intracellular multiplication protein IcmO